MRVIVAAVGRLKQGAERELAAAYRKRAEALGRSLGLRQIEVIEIRESRARHFTLRRRHGQEQVEQRLGFRRYHVEPCQKRVGFTAH